MKKEKMSNEEALEQALKVLENGSKEIDNILNYHCGNCINKKGNICLGMNAPITIETLIDCQEQTIYDCNMTINELKNKIDKFILWLKGHTYTPNGLYNDIIEKLKELDLLE